MAMAIARPDRTSSFSSQSQSPVDDQLLSALSSTNISGRYKHGSSSSSSSSTSTATDATTRHNTSEADDGPILSRLLVNRDLFPLIVRYLDTYSLLSLSSVNARFRREIFVPLTPNLCCLNLFLQERTVVCPMAQFENLKDFMAKYRCFKPIHLHFTYSDRSSLMSLVPENTAPIYNSKVDNTFSHPSTSPSSTSNLTGVNQSISINITSANSLYQHHHPLVQSPPIRQSLLHTQHENDEPETSSASSSGSLQALPTQHATINRLKNTRTSSSSSTDSVLSDSCDSTGEIRGRQAMVSSASAPTEDKNGGVTDIPNAGYVATSTTTMTTTTTATSTTLDNIASSGTTTYHQQKQQQQHAQEQQQPQLPQYTSRYVDYYGNGSSSHTPNNTHHVSFDLHPSTILSESIPVLSSSSSSTSPPLPGHGQHGFELSYWQKFALNELFMRLLPFLRTLTIGRTDKPTRRARDDESATVNGELSAGVCFFLARCFNVMHDMPDTALESVVWMDVTAKDVVLLITMIELRDIMVDERYWKRGYWAIDRPRMQHTTASGEMVDNEDDEDDGGDWDGFYYLINNEGSERMVSQPKKKPSFALSSGAGQAPRRKASSIRDFGSNASSARATAVSSESTTTSSSPRSPTTVAASFSRQTIAPLPTPQSVSGLGQLVKNASSTTTTTSSSTSAILEHTKKIDRVTIPAPEPWQGFGEGVLESNPRSVFPTDELPPAVQLYETLKAEINDVTAFVRSSGKGKRLASGAVF